ncbi:GNAT family N-acetyltransferase [Nocardioides conyzicola]|uniref:GNAT family N-acetyltransferase n=1 Tax=Nocardioides conyzicola TaxID=1651781 RepID=A0ABP8XL96_9ACTN
MVTVSTDAALLDLDTLHRWLSTDAYWAIGRPREVVERAVAGSLNFGAYDDGRLVGYARVVTDGATFAWLCDVYVDPAARGAGVGISLMEAVDAALTELQVRRTLLATADAHGLYAKFGFEPMAEPERWMLRTFAP